MSNFISTETIPASERYDFWNDVSSRYFVKLSCKLPEFNKTQPDSGFSAQLKHCPFGNLDLIDLQASPHSVERQTPQRSTEDYFLLSLMTTGTCQLTQDDRTTVIHPGGMVLYDTLKPYRIALPEDFRMCSLRIPGEMMRLYLPFPERLVALPLTTDTSVGRIAGNLVLSLFNEQDNLLIDQQGAMAKSVMEMLSVGLQSLSPDLALNSTSKLCQFHLERIKQAIEYNLGDPDLNVEQLSRALKMSVSSIYRAFESQPFTVSEYIWIQRLEVCKKGLSNPKLKERSISDIAYSWGFSNNAHFSRAFKRYTGQSPRDFKKSQLSQII